MLGFIASLVASGTGLAAPSTDFGVRVVTGQTSRPVMTGSADTVRSIDRPPPRSIIQPAAAIGARWGRVTSTYRSAARNRAVGGVRTSWHLSGRAIDIARRTGVRHADIAAAFRAAGYSLIESLDEGDHSHFAFGPTRAGVGATSVVRSPQIEHESTDWGIVTVSNRRGRGRAGR